MIKIHLDTDLGGDIDDICALAMLLKLPDVEIVGVTVVGDTNGKRTGYTKYFLDLAGRNDIPVVCGSDTSGGFYRYELGLPEEKNYWPEPIKSSTNPLERAIELLKKNIEAGVTIIGIGPYTNLYLLELKYPGILRRAKLFLMGGYIYPVRPGFPNWKNEFDFNIQVDVKSAEYVLKNSSPTLIPLSVTPETFLRKAYLGKLKMSGPVGNLLARQAESFAKDEKIDEKYGKTCEKLPSDIINFQHDPLACAVAIGYRDGIEIDKITLKIEIIDGWLYEKIDASGRIFKVVTKIDGPRFSKFWIDSVTTTQVL
jgi:inosine-uridine nucleoside N-ribohydrolase